MLAFLQTMPAAYARTFESSQIREHVAIVQRRGAQLVHAEICSAGGGAQICLVAEDRPGLLALVTDALLVHGLSIRNAQVYCRTRADGKSEAVDFFQLQQPGAPADSELGITPAELSAFLQTLSELVAEDVLAVSRQSSPPISGRPPTRVYFELEALRRGEFSLLVEAPDSEGLLNAISNALVQENVRIVSSEIRTEAGVAHDRFELAANGSEVLTATRLCDIQQAVHSALPRAQRRG